MGKHRSKIAEDAPLPESKKRTLKISLASGQTWHTASTPVCGKILAKAREENGLKDRAAAEAAVMLGLAWPGTGLSVWTWGVFACDVGKTAQSNALSRAGVPSADLEGHGHFTAPNPSRRQGFCSGVGCAMQQV